MPRRVLALTVPLLTGITLAQPWVLVPATGERVVLTGLQAGDVYCATAATATTTSTSRHLSSPRARR